MHFDTHIVTRFLMNYNPFIHTLPHTHTPSCIHIHPSHLHLHPPLCTYILGTWLLAVLVVISKFIVPHTDVKLQGLLYALIIGFCGCLTTVSTLVHEIDSLEIAPSYIYGITTNLMAQIGLILFYNVYAYYFYVQGKNGVKTPPFHHTPVSSLSLVLYLILCRVSTT